MKDWRDSKVSVFVTNGDSNHSEKERESRDYYATNPSCVERLLEKESFNNLILEPACGEGHISKVLLNRGYNVLSTDIVKRSWGGQAEEKDFFSYSRWIGDIVSNPPYSKAKEFTEKAIDIISEGNKLALFLKLTFLESEGRRKLFEKYPPRRIYVFSKRVNCAKNGNEKEFLQSSAVCYAWFIWEKGYKGLPEVDWI